MNRGRRPGYARGKPIGQIFGGPAFGGGWGILILICCIIGLIIGAAILIFVIINNDWLKKDARLVGGGSKCDDGNPCTRDLKHVAGGCVHHFENNRHRCHNPCFVPEDPDPEDDDDDWGHRCDAKGDCVGSKCCGDCKHSRQCPDIEFKPYTVVYGEKDCVAKGCVYSAFAPILLETPCDKPFATEICTGFLDKEFNKTQCLKVTPVCEHPSKRHGHGRNGEQEEETREGNHDNIATVAFCMYDFRCSMFCPPKIIIRDNEDGATTKTSDAKPGLAKLPWSSKPVPLRLNKLPAPLEDDSFDAVIESFRERTNRAG